MSGTQYDIVFNGEILDGLDPDDVKARFAAAFNLGTEAIERLFSHPRVVLKKNLTDADANRFQAYLTDIGIKTTLRPAAAQAPETAAASPAAARTTPAEPAHLPVRDALETADSATPPGTSVASAPSHAAEKPRTINFEFTGNGFEYFKIWIVNILLTIVTLGIYSAWAKVRTNRYFYGNTRLDGSSFEYLANPVSILKGRLIAVAFFIVLNVVGSLSPILGFVFSLLIIVLMPWLIVRALAFRARYSAYRNIRFGFDGRLGEAAMAFIVWPLVGLVTFGIMFPYALYKQNRFIVENSRYGTSKFTFRARAKDYFMVFLMALAILFVGGLIASLLGALVPPLGVIGMLALYLGIFAWFTVSTTNLKYNNTVLGEHNLVGSYELRSFAMLFLTNTLAMVLTLGLFYPWAKVRTARYAAGHIQFFATGSLDGFIAAQEAETSSLGQEMVDIFDFDIGL